MNAQSSYILFRPKPKQYTRKLKQNFYLSEHDLICRDITLYMDESKSEFLFTT